MKFKITYGFFAISIVFSLLAAASAHADFRNQMSLLGTAGVSQDNYIAHAKQFGYEWVVGDPWSEVKAAAAEAAGLKVLFNSNADRAAKWYRFNNTGTKASPGNPTQVNIGIGNRPISPELYEEFETALCMTQEGVNMPRNQIYNGTDWKYIIEEKSDTTLIFIANRQSVAGTARNVDANVRLLRLQEEEAGKKLYHGLYFDEVTFPTNHGPKCYNPGNPPASAQSKDTFDTGRRNFIAQMKTQIAAEVGAGYGGASGNPWNMSDYDPEYNNAAIALDLLYSESSGGLTCNELSELRAGAATGCGTQDTTSVALWGNVPKHIADVQLGPTHAPGEPGPFEANYEAGQLIAGRAAWQGIWLGWFGAVDISDSNNATQLIRAIPNWDNMVGVPLSQRSWNEAADVYHSTNSHIDNGVAYSRRWTDGKLFVVWQTNTAPVTLRSGESVVSVKCVNNLFIETTDCASHVTVSTANPKTITLNSPANELKGYVITHTGGGGATSGSTTGGASGFTTGGLPPSGCNQYTPSSPIPEAFGSPFWVASNPSQALISVNCPPTGPASLSAGVSTSNVYVYKDVYVHKDGSWQKLTLSGAPAYGGTWYQGAATAASLPFTNEELTTQRYAVAYVCTYTGSTWKCGCRTSACTGADSGKWSLMPFRKSGAAPPPDTVATPIITPNGGTFSSSQTVTLTTSTTGAEVRYTINGTEPTTSSTLYTAAFNLTDTATVKAKAWKTGLTPSGIATAVFTKSSSAARPNIVVIMTDDQDVASVAKMPLLNTLLKQQGVTFTNSFVNFALCCPSRATFLTGQHSVNNNVEDNGPPTGGYARLNHANTLPVWLQTSGYVTGFFGKHLNRYGVDVPRTTVPPGWNKWFGVLGASDYNDPTFNEDGIETNLTGYTADIVTNKAAQFITSRSGSATPFFMWVSYDAPHHPAIPATRHAGMFNSEPLPMPPSFNEADVSDKPVNLRWPIMDAARIDEVRTRYRLRLESLQAVDDGIQSVINSLQSAGKLSNTVIMYISDNGWFQGEHRIYKNKDSYYEPSIRVPLIIRGPGIPANVTRDKIVSNIDLAPTIVDLANATSGRTMDGKSLIPLINNPSVSWRTALFIDGKVREPSDSSANSGPLFDGIRTPRYLYVQHADSSRELYDLQVDPHQLQSKHADAGYTAVKNDLQSKLNTLKTCVGVACWITAPEVAP